MATAENTPTEFETRVDRIATGGRCLGVAPDGRTLFVPESIPGERVSVEVVKEYSRRLDGRLKAVIEPSADRVEPSCAAYHDGCGGCDWLHIAASRQSQLRIDIVADCLRRLGRLDDVEIRGGPKLPADGYRTTVRAAVVNGKAGFRSRDSHDVVSVDTCQISHPMIERMLAESFWGSAEEVVLRVGHNTGESMAIVSPLVTGDVRVAEVNPASPTVIVGADELAGGRPPHIHETLDGVRLQISAGAFFQCRPDGATALAGAVQDVIAAYDGVLLDAYCGVGLFGVLCGMGRSVVAVEANPAAAGDARWNLRNHGEVFETRFEQWPAQPVGVAVADPARAGLQADGVAKLVECGPAVIALVSCDPASLARDAALLDNAGYGLDRVTVVDLFGQTSHVETVSAFTRR